MLFVDNPEAAALRERAVALLCEAADLQRQARELMEQAAKADRDAHERLMNEDSAYRDGVGARRQERIRSAERDLFDSPFPAITTYDRERRQRVPITDTVTVTGDNYTLRVCRRAVEDPQIALHHIGPRGGCHGELSVAEDDLPAIAELIDRFAGQYAEAFAFAKDLTLEVTDATGCRWEMNNTRDRWSRPMLMKQGFTGIPISANALASVAELLRRRPITGVMYDDMA